MVLEMKVHIMKGFLRRLIFSGIEKINKQNK